MNVIDTQKPIQIGRFEVYCLKNNTIKWNWYETTNYGLRDWSAVPDETVAKIKAHVAASSAKLAWIWELELDGWEFQGKDCEEKRIMDGITSTRGLLAPLDPETRNQLHYHIIRSLIEDIPMPPAWKALSDRRAEPSDNIRARIAGLEDQLEMRRACK